MESITLSIVAEAVYVQINLSLIEEIVRRKLILPLLLTKQFREIE